MRRARPAEPSQAKLLLGVVIVKVLVHAKELLALPDVAQRVLVEEPAGPARGTSRVRRAPVAIVLHRVVVEQQQDRRRVVVAGALEPRSDLHVAGLPPRQRREEAPEGRGVAERGIVGAAAVRHLAGPEVPRREDASTFAPGLPRAERGDEARRRDGLPRRVRVEPDRHVSCDLSVEPAQARPILRRREWIHGRVDRSAPPLLPNYLIKLRTPIQQLVRSRLDPVWLRSPARNLRTAASRPPESGGRCPRQDQRE